jgi:hypothetical protein
MAKDPGERPAADEFLVQIGPVQPAAGWLPKAVTRPVREDQAPEAGAVPDPPPAPIEVEDGQPTATRLAQP